MKNKIKKSIGVILLLLIILLSSCNKESSEHTHDYKLKNDEKLHYQECSCEEKKDSESHNLDWTVDTEPTYSAPGYKHKECTVCGYITDENTVIERLLHEEVITDELVDPSIKNSKSFSNPSELKAYYNDSKDEILSNFICINSEFPSDSGINIEWLNRVNYSFNFNTNSDKKNNYYKLTTNLGIYSSELGTDTDVLDDVPYHSITFKLISYAYSEEINDVKFEFYKYSNPNYIWNYMIKVYNGKDIIGNIYYFTGLEIDKEWISNFLTNNLIILD